MKIENVRNGCNNENVPLGVCSANSKLRGPRLSTEKKHARRFAPLRKRSIQSRQQTHVKQDHTLSLTFISA
jgi:hypothetical protein